jgi:PAS domain S-box-containing protein
MSDDESLDRGTDDHGPELYRKLVENSNDVATIIDPNGVITYVSPSVRRVLGYEPEELVGEVGFEYQHPDDREVVAERIEALQAEPAEPQTAEVRFERADGSWCWIEATMQNRLDDDVIGGILVNSRDVTDRKADERRHSRLAEEYEALLDNSQDAIFLLDVDSTGEETEFRFTRLSAGYETQTGLSTEEVQGKTPRAVFGEERGAELAANYRRCVKQGEPIAYQEELVVADDARYWQTSLAPVVIDGEVVRIVGIARNVTERVEQERRLRRKKDRLDEFASVVSHDVRNPLNVAQARATLLQETVESEHLPPLVRALDRIQSIVEDTLELARQGDTVGHREPIAMTELVGRGWGMIDSGDATLEIADEFVVHGDPDRLQQVFENLFRNSVEHGGDGVTVRVGRTSEGGFYVEDDGPGIPEEDRDAIFAPGETSRSDGTGFGLPIVGRIAEAHGWRVAVTDGSDGGARFEFRGVETGATTDRQNP